MGRNMPFSPELDYILFQSTRYSGFRDLKKKINSFKQTPARLYLKQFRGLKLDFLKKL